MSFLSNIFISNRGKFFKIAGLGLISGIMSFCFLAFFNLVIKEIISGHYLTINKNLILIYSIIILLMIWSRKMMSQKVIILSQQLFWTIRFDILKTVLKSDYKEFIANKSKIQSSVMNDVDNLTEASLTIIEFTISTVVVIFCFVYLLILSPSLFVITFIVSIIGVIIYLINAKKNNEKLSRARTLENNFFYYFNSLMDGFKEISMNSKIGDNILKNKVKPIAESAFQNNKSAFFGLLNNQVTGQMTFYFLLVSILLVFSIIINVESITIVNFTFVLLYLLGAIESIMVMLPILFKSKISLRNLLSLKLNLKAADSNAIDAIIQSKERFRSLTLTEFCYTHQVGSDKTFKIGPINLTINSGDLIFIHGGNGSGKTTFINTLIGLYSISSGTLSLNDQLLSEKDYNFYKSYFSVVFSDFYLFDEFYSVENLDFEMANYYLNLFELQDKVQISEIGFSTQQLSTGQRKRLALITSLLEKPSILVLDEWAADQDPYFRKIFYEEILPNLKNAGITVLAITHDDRYYHCADFIYKMEFGKLYNDTDLFKTHLINIV